MKVHCASRVFEFSLRLFIMARQHGWELPAHTFQVVAISVYLLLSVAFYAFFSPFPRKDIYEHVAIGVYSLALCVFILHVRFTTIDPVDPDILIEPYREIASPYRSHNGTEVPGNASFVGEPSKIGFQNVGIYSNGSSVFVQKLGDSFVVVL